MAKLWYPMALAVTMAGCDDPADSGYRPPATGGSTKLDTSVATPTGGRSSSGGTSATDGGTQPTGGSTSIDTGTPASTGGQPLIIYGAIGVYGFRRLL